ncbi:hypothetical protein [Alkalihalobacillus deserti]|uniref:hypothetical protein n=1 Tax=Alkalihalobacillus deserti TaxID=2879466 RepID=UPI001D1569D6|nr:hypothetical protein [Alkalihalobacillus deserti]
MYKLLFTLKKRKGIQAHVLDKQEDVIHLLYLHPRSLKPKEDIPPNLTKYLAKMKEAIKEGDSFHQLDDLRESPGA